MKRKKVIIFCIISVVLMMSISHIPAVTYHKTKENIYANVKNHIQMDNADQLLKNTIQDQIESIKEHVRNNLIQSKGNIFSLFSIIINFILSVIVLILNILITIISLASGLINAVFSTTLNILIGIIKQLLNLSIILEKILDIISSIASGLFGIFLNIVVGILTIIKNVIVDIISPNAI